MIKYIRMANSHVGARETRRFPVATDLYIPVGTLCQVYTGTITTAYSSGKPCYVTLESKRSDDAKTELECLRLENGMVIELTLSTNLTEVPEVGTVGSIGMDTDDNFSSFTTDGATLEIIGKNGRNAVALIHNLY